MRADLDHLMQERSIDTLIIPGNEGRDPYRDYLANGVHASAMVIKKQGSAPVLIVSDMEADEAAKSGLQVLTYNDLGWAEIMQTYKEDREAIWRELWRNILSRFEIRGRVAFYGHGDIMQTWKMLNRLQRDFGDLIQIVEEENEDKTLFGAARRTKDQEELEKLRDSGKRTSAVLKATREWLSSHAAKGEVVVKADGAPLTIGEVKHFVRLKLMEQGLEDADGMIFAQGRDAGVPHSRGEDDQPLMTGKTIVFDLFPRPINGGYYHDSTRTWALGYAPPEVEEAYRQVMHAFTQSLEAVALGAKTRDVQDLVCDIFEKYGHPTPKSNPATTVGYTHSLGHGIGLNVHEAPSMRNYAPDSVVFEAGDVITIEPGLYYPDKGWGIRVEDSVYLDASGQVHNLTDCPYDLVIPLNGKVS